MTGDEFPVAVEGVTWVRPVPVVDVNVTELMTSDEFPVVAEGVAWVRLVDITKCGTEAFAELL